MRNLQLIKEKYVSGHETKGPSMLRTAYSNVWIVRRGQ